MITAVHQRARTLFGLRAFHIDEGERFHEKRLKQFDHLKGQWRDSIHRQ